MLIRIGPPDCRTINSFLPLKYYPKTLYCIYYYFFSSLFCLGFQLNLVLLNLSYLLIACVASVSVCFWRKKDRSRNEIFGFGRSFTCAIFRVAFDSCSSFFAPKPHGNACYAGYSFVIPQAAQAQYVIREVSYCVILKMAVNITDLYGNSGNRFKKIYPRG